jgi:hypothetical protein
MLLRDRISAGYGHAHGGDVPHASENINSSAAELAIEEKVISVC